MKSKLFAVLLVISYSLTGFAQQAVYQLSDGGTPWGAKFTQFDSEIPIMGMGLLDMATLEHEDSIHDLNKNGSFRFGFNHFVNYNLNNSGYWKTLDNGDRVWRIGFNCPGAISVNLAFQYLSIPVGAKLFIYNEDRSVVLGAFTQQYVSPDLEFGTELLAGETVIVEYYVPSNIVNVGSLEIFRVTHGYRTILDYANRAFGGSGACENNAMCPAYSAYANQIKSVVCLVSGGSEFCTGALINNTCNDGTPYVLTANHCGSSGFGSWVFRFNWQAPGCSNPASSPSSQSLSGGTQRAANPGSDMSLVQINSAVPAGYNAYFSGWDRTNTASVNQVAIHHPAGDIKKVSLATGTATTATYGSATCWKTGTWTDGVTEPGSSGSPLFNTSGLIIGQLYGGPSDCTCENNAGCGYDYYGKLFTSWTGGGTDATRLSNWLAPAGCGAAPNTLVGYDPNAVSLTYDAQVQSITSPTGNICIGSFSPVIVIKNNGTTLLNAMTINYQIDGGAASPYVWSGSLASGASTNVIMPSITIAAGAHTYTATIVTSSLNGSQTDLNTGNNALTSNYTGINAASSVLPLAYGFEAVAMPPTTPAAWTLTNGLAGSITFARTTAAFSLGTASAWLNYFVDNTGTGTTDDLVLPYLDFSSVGAPSTMTFDVAHRRYSASYIDSLRVQVSTNCGASWTTLYSKGGTTLATVAGDLTTTFTPTAAQWRNESINLNAYAGLNNVLIRFQGYSGYGQNIYIDNINIQGTPAVPPTASFTVSDNTICVGQSVTYTNTSVGATSFTWAFPGGSPVSGSTSPINVTYGAVGTYTTTLTANNISGSSTTTQTITVSANPTNTASNSGPYCPGATIQLNATAGATDYDWTGPNGYVQNNVQNPTIANATAIMAGIYTVTVTNAAGCTATATTTVTINSAPTPTANNTGPYCPGLTIQLNSPSGSATDDWAGPNSYVQNNVQNPTIPGATLLMDGIYTVTVTNGFGCSATATTTVSIINTSSANANNTGPYCAGQTINLSSLGGGTGYLWSGPLSYSNGTQNPSIASSTAGMSGVYSVTITFAGGCTASATTSVTVNSSPTAPVITPSGPTTFCSGNSVNLTSSYASGNVWSNSATTATISVNSGGTYTVTYTDGNGCTNTASQAVTVNNLPIVTQSALGNICLTYAPVILSGGSPVGGVYSGTGVSAGQFDPAVSGSGTFNITYTYTDGNSCTSSAIASIVVLPCAGIDGEDATEIVVYPNPTNQYVTISGMSDGIYDYSIITTLGQVLRAGQLLGDGMIDLGIFANGTYYLKVDNKFWKIIKQ